MALVDMYEIKNFMDLGLAREVMNIYHVVRESGSIDAADINQAFIDWVLPAVVDVQVTNLTHTRLETVSLGDPTDFAIWNLTGFPGGVVGEGSPTFAASRIQFLQETKSIRHGWKRFPGLPETLVNFNTGVASLVTTLQNIADQICTGWEIATTPGTVICRFAIIGRICAEVDAAGVCLAYRLPENDAELEFYIPSQGIGRSTIGSQNSRKTV